MNHLVLVLGLLVFLGIHSASIAAPQWRLATMGRLGEKKWKGLFSLASAVGLALIVVGYGLARREPVPLYLPPLFLRHLSLLLMVPVFPLLIATYFPGRISAAAKHPMLLSVKLWAAAHLLANGNLGDVLLFGSFLAWAVADRISVKRRPAVERHDVPAVRSGMNDVIVIVGGLAAYALTLFWLHRVLIGVSPLP